MRRTASALAFVAASAIGAATLLTFAALDAPAQAQAVHEAQPLHVTVGSPAATSGAFFPTDHLRAAWTTHVAASLEYAPVFLPNEQLFIATPSGEAVVLDDAGKTLTKFATGSRAAAPAARLSDGTVLLLTATGDALGIRAGQTRFRTRIFAETRGSLAVLALGDGGAVLSSGSDLVAIDGAGNARAHVSLPESPAEPLVAIDDAVAVVGTSGAVQMWVPGRELERAGTFGERTEGVVAIGRTLTAIAGGRLLDLDTVQKSETTRFQPVRGGFVGQPVRIDDDVAALFRDGTHVELVQVARDGSERRRVTVAVVSGLVVDAGAGSPNGANGASGASNRNVRGNVPGAAANALGEISSFGFAAAADASGAVAFAIPQGPLGVVARDGSVVTAASPCLGQGGVPTGARNVTTALFPARGPASSAALLVSCSTGNLQELVSSQK